MSAHVGHAAASKNYSWAHVGHTPACVGQTVTRVAAAESGETHEKGGVARLMVKLPEVDISGFEKKKNQKL